MKFKRAIVIVVGLTILLLILPLTLRRFFNAATYTIGQPLDSLHGVYVYYNGGVDNVSGRNVAPDNYNLGLKYQCVEFVKRYYYQHLKHKMPDSYGHAKDFCDNELKDGQHNKKRDLIQYSNSSKTKPRVGDLLIFDKTSSNPYGHVAIVSRVVDSEVEIIQQNSGQFGPSRATFELTRRSKKWAIEHPKILGWLRKE